MAHGVVCTCYGSLPLGINCLETKISSRPNTRIEYGPIYTFTFTFIFVVKYNKLSSISKIQAAYTIVDKYYAVTHVT